MSTQRMGVHYIPAADAHVAALIYVAAAVTLACAGVVVAAVEHRRHEQERAQIRHEIDGLQRWLSEN